MEKKNWLPLAEKLERLDSLERQARKLRHELATEVADYGRSIGVYGFNIDHFRVRLNAMLEMV